MLNTHVCLIVSLRHPKLSLDIVTAHAPLRFASCNTLHDVGTCFEDKLFSVLSDVRVVMLLDSNGSIGNDVFQSVG